MIKFPDKKYNIIYIDPPWKYNLRNNPNTRFGSGMHIYPGMELHEIKRLPIQTIADENCLLFMWTTPPQLINQIWIPDLWGFEYVTKAFCWIKMNARNEKYRFGNGYYCKSNTEDCYLYRKGKIQVINNSISQIIDKEFPSDIITHIRDHSRKPDEVRDKIVQLVGDLPRIELFARGQYLGWDVWGNQTFETIY